MKAKNVTYSISIDEIKEASRQFLGREITDKEMELVIKSLKEMSTNLIIEQALLENKFEKQFVKST